MTTLLDSPMNVVEALRGDRATRPPVDRTSAAGLRASLEDGLYEVLGIARPTSPIIVRSASLRRASRTMDLTSSAHGRLRGVLVNHVLRLWSVGTTVGDAFDDALCAWRATGDDGSIALVDTMDVDERARLATDVAAHGVTLTRSLGPIPSQWMPRSSVRANQSLAGGNVLLRDVAVVCPDQVVLFDVTTAPLGEGVERAMRYHALVQTLRTSAVPLRTSAFSTATGELWVRDVDHEMLTRSVGEVLACVADRWAQP
jgi:ribosomal protein S13